MLKALVSFICLLIVGAGMAQTANPELAARSKAFHQAMVQNGPELAGFLHSQLSFGHSTGRLETKADMVQNIGKPSRYKQILEDSVTTELDGDLGWVRSKVDVTIDRGGETMAFKVKLLEVWARQEGNWVLFAAQSVRVD
jgi:hypothetical protein